MYAWMAIANREKGNAPLQAIKKLDLAKGPKHIWSASPKGFVGEPLMIPSHNKSEEDSGWVLVLVWNSTRRGTDLVILDASNLSEVAVLEIPIAMPHGLHGCWVPNVAT